MEAFFTQAKSDAWFKSGLAKSAFTPRIYGGLPLDVYMPGINLAWQFYHVRMKHEEVLRIAPKFYMVHDAFMMFYRPFEEVVASLKRRPKKSSAWWELVRRTVTSSDFYRLNAVTRGSQELAALAAAKWLATVFRRVADKMMGAQLSGTAVDFLDKQSASALPSLYQCDRDLAEVVSEALRAAAAKVREYAEAKSEAEEAITALAGAGGSGYSHEALSVWSFLKRPDEFRRRVELLKTAALFAQRFSRMVPTSVQHQQQASVWGGISGVDRMVSELQLKDVLPSELAALAVRDQRLRKLLKLDFLLRLSQKQVMVYQRSAAVKPVVFVDKSGSMAERFRWGDPPKISVAAGLALALYRKLRADVYLFDTEVEKVDPAKVVETLLTISAGGGTDITEVLREIARIGSRDRVYIVITDGIDEVDQSVIDELERRGLAARVRFILVPPAWEKPWLRHFKWYYAEDVASFERASREALRG